MKRRTRVQRLLRIYRVLRWLFATPNRRLTIAVSIALIVFYLHSLSHAALGGLLGGLFAFSFLVWIVRRENRSL